MTRQPIGRPSKANNGSHANEGAGAMILATTKVEDIDRFLDVFSTQGAEKRAEHGSKGSTVFRDPSEQDRVWALFDWDEEGWAAFVSDPDVPAILKAAGHVGKPQAAPLAGAYGA
jgi:hypothetical protein